MNTMGVLAQRFFTTLVGGNRAAVSTRQWPFYTKADCCKASPTSSVSYRSPRTGKSENSEFHPKASCSSCDFV